MDRAKLDLLEVLWDLKAGQRVIEFGCGAGRLAKQVGDAVGPEGAFVAVVPGDGAAEDALALPGRVFDHALCINSFPCFWDPVRALGALSGLLKPGGSLWVAQLRGRREPWRWPCPHRPRATIQAEAVFRRLPDLAAAAGFETVATAHWSGLSWFHARRASGLPAAGGVRLGASEWQAPEARACDGVH
jgi:ubiquinone/menaquinone biosynthesis C-methylase UbiE